MPKAKIVPSREPNGRMSRAAQLATDACSPAEVRRLRDASLAGMRQPEWGTELGRLFLSGRLVGMQFEAGKRWARLAEAARAALSGPKVPARSTFAEHAGGQAPDPDSERGRRQAERDRDIVQDMHEARRVLLAVSPSVELAVREVCEDERSAVSADELERLVAGLDRLADHWGLTQRRKTGS